MEIDGLMINFVLRIGLASDQSYYYEGYKTE